MRAGVPVFMRPASKPIATSDSVMPVDAASPALPPSARHAPQCMSPPRKVPLVSTTARAANSTPMRVRSPVTRGRAPPAEAASEKSSSAAASCQM